MLVSIKKRHSVRHLKLPCEYLICKLSYTKVRAAKDHGKNYVKVRMYLVCHLLHDRLPKKIMCFDSLCFFPIIQATFSMAINTSVRSKGAAPTERQVHIKSNRSILAFFKMDRY